MTHTNFKGKELLEWNDLFAVDNENYKVLTKDFFELLKVYFLTKEKIKDINAIKEELKNLRNDFNHLEGKKSEGIEQELKEISKQVQNFKKEIEQATQKAKTQMQEEKNKAMEDLQKKYLLELNNPLLEKSQIVLNVIIELYEKTKHGFDDYIKMDKLKDEMQKVIPPLTLDKETKNNLLEISTKESYWKRGQVNDWSNDFFVEALRKIRNYLLSGEKPEDILLSHFQNTFKFGLRLGKGQPTKETEQEPREQQEGDLF